MSGLLLHEKTRVQLDIAVDTAGGLIFYGTKGLGKYATALSLAKRLNCQADTAAARGQDDCSFCVQIDAGNFPDLLVMAPPDDKKSIGVENVRQITQKLSAKPYYPRSARFLIVDEAELLTPAAQNALLKLIEEPPPRTRVVLVTTSLGMLLATVRSRLMAVYFVNPGNSRVASWLVSTAGVKSAEAELLAELADGIPGLALELARDSTRLTAAQSDADRVVSLLKSDLFRSLVVARDLADARVDPLDLAAKLHRQVKSELLCGIISSTIASQHLESVERLRVMSLAGVSQRVALERFVLGVFNA